MPPCHTITPPHIIHGLPWTLSIFIVNSLFEVTVSDLWILHSQRIGCWMLLAKSPAYSKENMPVRLLSAAHPFTGSPTSMRQPWQEFYGPSSPTFDGVWMDIYYLGRCGVFWGGLNGAQLEISGSIRSKFWCDSDNGCDNGWLEHRKTLDIQIFRDNELSEPFFYPINDRTIQSIHPVALVRVPQMSVDPNGPWVIATIPIARVSSISSFR